MRSPCPFCGASKPVLARTCDREVCIEAALDQDHRARRDEE